MTNRWYKFKEQKERNLNHILATLESHKCTHMHAHTRFEFSNLIPIGTTRYHHHTDSTFQAATPQTISS